VLQGVNDFNYRPKDIGLYVKALAKIVSSFNN